MYHSSALTVVEKDMTKQKSNWL